MAKLLTNHDQHHLHAACGIVALLHYFYRFYLVCLDVPYGGFGTNIRTDLISMIVMIFPNLTSFIFDHVPVKKSSDGFTIWKEYRWHAFIFGVKMWLLQAMCVYKVYTLPPGEKLQYERYYRAAMEFGVMLIAQYVTNQYPKQETTIRGMYKASWSVFMAGFMQFMGRAAIMLGGFPDPQDDIAVCILPIFILQLNAFNMTLRKKRIIGPKSTQAFYSTMLLSGFYLVAVRRFWANPPTGIFDSRFKFVYLASIAYFSRRQGLDRFSSWIVALSVLALATQKLDLFQELSPQEL